MHRINANSAGREGKLNAQLGAYVIESSVKKG